MGSVKKIVSVKGKEIGGAQPQICTPLIGKGVADLLNELDQIIPKEPDIIEWRADFFDELSNTREVVCAAQMIRERSKDIPLLFTIRSEREGGQPINLVESEKVQLLVEICQARVVDLIDFELSSTEEDIQKIREASRENGTYLVLSYHNFDETPDPAFIVDKLQQAEKQGADIGKVAVMPNSKEDVLALLSATQNAQKDLTIPIVTISMGELGAISRMAGFIFGSAITFAVGNESSAPGQIEIGDLRMGIDLLQKASRG